MKDRKHTTHKQKAAKSLRAPGAAGKLWVIIKESFEGMVFILGAIGEAFFDDF